MEGSRDKDQVLALKVMRLTKPSLMMGEACYGEEGRQAEGEGGERKEGEGGDNDCMLALRKVHNAQLASAHNLTEFRLGSLLTLPQNFGNIFLGETFSSYISVHNDSQETCKDITVKADLQTSSQRLTLSRNATKPTASLEPGRSIDDVIQHEVKELGTHILVCTVSYLTAAGENMFLRKFFKFQVLKPLDVKTKFYNAESDEVFLEAQIQNITPGPIFVDHVSLEPSQDYQITNIDVPSDKELFGKVNCMSPLDIRQYLYCLIPKHESAKNSHLLKGVTNIGKLDIVWHTNMGEKGRLQTSALQRMAPGYGDLRVTITDVPDEVFAEKPFSFTCNVTNCSERSMQLDLFFENVPSSTGVTWAGISGQSLGNCAPGHTVKHPLKIVPLKTGLQTVSGLRIVDTFLGRKYEHDDLFQIFVYSEANHVRI